MKVFAGEACDRFTKEGGDTAEEVYKVGYYKYLSWVYGVDRKICHEGH